MTWIWIWLGISISLLLMEISTEKLNLNYFIFSSILALATTRIFNKFLYQFIIFVLVGLFLYLYHEKLINIVEKIYKKDMIGRKAKVIKLIKKGEVGIVKINKLKYKAISIEEIKENSIVEIVDISEFILKVKPVK